MQLLNLILKLLSILEFSLLTISKETSFSAFSAEDCPLRRDNVKGHAISNRDKKASSSARFVSVDRANKNYNKSDQNKSGSEYSVSRKKRIKKHKKTRPSSAEEYYYTETPKLRIFIGTWNVNGKNSPKSLYEWLSIDSEPPDIYAIGLQELRRANQNLQDREDDWLEALTNALHPNAKYRNIATVRLAGILLVIFANQRNAGHIRRVESCKVSTVIWGTLGNKGGVAVRFDIYDTSMCFINAHLQPHIPNNEKRNQDYNNISSNILFSNHHPYRKIDDHDQIFWFGDLNYRITDLNVYTVKKLIDSGDYNTILAYDQLYQSRLLRHAFTNYKEGPITFKPTYSYDPGTDEWDSSEKCRIPAWCDRILWKGNNITQITYRSHPFFKISDHKPVSAVFYSQHSNRSPPEEEDKKNQANVVKRKIIESPEASEENNVLNNFRDLWF